MKGNRLGLSNQASEVTARKLAESQGCRSASRKGTAITKGSRRAWALLACLLCVSSVFGKDEIPAGAFLSNPWLQKPFKTILASANAGDVDAVLAMATIYDMGKKFGATAEIQEIPADLAKAVLWYEKGAEQNDWRAQYNLAVLYYDGRGVEANHVKAKDLFERAAESGQEMAQAGLGMYYMNVEIGGRPYPWYKEGAKCHLLAAQGGNWYSQYTVATLYEAGLGVVRDPVEALKWFLISASNGHRPALVEASRLENTLTPTAVETARALARAFIPRPSGRPDPTTGQIVAIGGLLLGYVIAGVAVIGFGSVLLRCFIRRKKKHTADQEC